MPFTDKNGKIWPDTQTVNGVNLILDPVASTSSGRPKYRPDPRQRQNWAEQYGFAEKPQQPPSPLQGLAMTGAAAGVPVLANQLGQYVGGLFGQGKDAETIGGQVADQGLSKVGQSVLSNSAAAPGGSMINIPGLDSFGQMPGQFTLDGGATEIGSSALSDGTVAAAQPGSFSLSGIGSAGNVLLPAAGAFGAYDLWKSNRGAENKGMGALQGAASGAAMGSYFGPWGALAGGVLGGAYGATQHMSTRDKQREKLGKLLDSGVMPNEMPGVSEGIIQDMGHGDRELYSGQLKGKDVWGVSGMFDTFGKDWLGKYSEAQREQIAQRLLDEKLLDSRKGLTRVVDQDRAQQIAQQIYNNLVNQAALAQAAKPATNQQGFRR